MALNTKQDAIDFLNMVKSDADSDGIDFQVELLKYVRTVEDDSDETSRVYQSEAQIENITDLLEKFHPTAGTSPDSDVVSHAEQWMSAEFHTGFIK